MIVSSQCFDSNMESHTLEILQQGVWASLTGGWFYDIRQNVFCNTFHLYLWLFLLCFPFILHLILVAIDVTLALQYFIPSVATYSFYCGIIGVLFTTLKLINHRLHIMFDTSQCIHETISSDNLPESQKKRSQMAGTKTTLEDEGIELQVLNEPKVIEPLCNDSMNEQTDDDSIMSLETGAKAVSSTIDLKVDVHRKNSSESSDNISYRPRTSDSDVIVLNDDDDDDDDAERIDSLNDFIKTASHVAVCTQRCKHAKLKNAKFGHKVEEGITAFDGCDFILSQSDCYIAERRKKSLDESSLECKMSQSECHISKLRKSSSEKREVENKEESSSIVDVHKNSGTKDLSRKRMGKAFGMRESSTAQSGSAVTIAIEMNKSFDMGNLMSSTSDGADNDWDSLNTGSLELPLRDVGNDSAAVDKGLLYWKKQNLRESQSLYIEGKSEETCADVAEEFNETTTLRIKGIESEDESIRFDDPELVTKNSGPNDQSFLKILEENFDWCGGDYRSNEFSPMATKGKLGFVGKFQRNEELKNDWPAKRQTSLKCGLKFQVDSDEDTSDNRGSQSPLLWRHREHGEDAALPVQVASAGVSSRSLPLGPEERRPFRVNMNRTLSVDGKSDSQEESKCNKLNTLKNSFSSILLTVYDGNGSSARVPPPIFLAKKTEKSASPPLDTIAFNSDESPPCKTGADPGDPKTGVSVQEGSKGEGSRGEADGEKFLMKNLSASLRDATEEMILGLKRNDTGFESGKLTIETGEKNVPGYHVERFARSRGAIPKTRTRVGVHHSEDRRDTQTEGRKLSVSEEGMNEGEIPRSKTRDGVAVPSSSKDSARKETYDSSSNSTSELSSLLPLSSLLSSLHPPASPLLAAFLAARKEIPESVVIAHAPRYSPVRQVAEPLDDGLQHNVTFMRNKHKKNHKRSGRAQRSSRVSARVSSIPLVALASFVSTHSGIHIATSHEDTSQGALHCFQDERGNWMSYTFDSEDVGSVRYPVPIEGAVAAGESPGWRSYDDSDRRRVVRIGRKKSVTSNVAPSSGREQGLTGLHLLIGNPSPRNVHRDVGDRHVEQSQKDSVQDENPVDGEKVPGEAWDSSINLVSNSNSETESSLSFNSTTLSPTVDPLVARPSFASFVRERLVVNQRSTTSGTRLSGNVNAYSLNSNLDPVLHNINDFCQLDSKIMRVSNVNGNDCNNNNNNNSSSSSNDAPDSRNSHSETGTCMGSRRVGSFNLEGIPASGTRRSPFGFISDSFFERSRQTAAALEAHLSTTDPESDRNHFATFDLEELTMDTECKSKPSHYYKLHYTPWSYVKIRFDRLELTALLDQNLTAAEIVLSLLLSSAVSACGIVLLNYGFYRDLFAFLFCFTLAGCQYSLLKSVQPDATSPTHGYNRIVVYSRSIYFCVVSLLVLLLTGYVDQMPNVSFVFYGIHFTRNNSVKALRDGLVTLLLFFPVLFTLGLLPQINTFCLYVLEQVDVHVFGGNGMSSLPGAIYCVLRSCFAVFFVYGFAYGALCEPKASQHILFSIFCGLLVSISYHLSRSSSSPNVFWDILKDQLFQEDLSKESTYLRSVKKDRVESPVGEKDNVLRGNGKEKPSEGDSPSSESSNAATSTNDLGHESSRPRNHLKPDDSESENPGKEDFVDPLPGKLKETVNARLRNDVIVCTTVALLVFGIHCSTVFTALQPDLNAILWGIAGCSGLVLHYVVPELRKHLPWLCLAEPVLKCQEFAQFEVKSAARIMWFEETYVTLRFLERNLLYPVLVLAAVTHDGPRICAKFGVPLGALFTTVSALKIMRSAFSNPPQQYLIVIFAALLFEFDFYSCGETFLIDYFFMGIIFSKTYEFLLKVQFVVIYIAPWQITWGSAFHAFAQPFSVPHSAMLFVQAAISAVLSAPLNPFLGSAIFLASYVRPIKFWERDYNTRRVDHSNTRMSSHLERNLGSDDNNLNSIFYEHLTRSLQHSLCGDLELGRFASDFLGRWGPVCQGDCFVLASDYLNCLVHIIEMGNGLVTFQVRGLEFRGTYCQQREVEAISERTEDDDGCCCCEPCHLPHVLGVNAAFSKRWLAWEVTASKYVLEGYSISDNSAASTLQVFDFRKVLVTYYVKSIIFYCVRSSKLHSWLTNPTILAALKPLEDRSFVDLDPVFNVNIDQDFDVRAEGITRNSFCSVYLDWIHYCRSQRDQPLDNSLDASIVSLCLALSLIGRRTLGTASHNTMSTVELFLYGLHALFKGDFRITSVRDDWIFADMEFLVKVVAPGVRMSLKLHQDHFMSPDEYEDPRALFDAISAHEENLVISHEGDPAWRSAVLSGKPSLLALRHVLDDGSDDYKIIMLNKRFLSFRVIKLNRECVRGLWAGQQQELVFLRNRNPERGSIQNAKQVLRNMINSSCDQPIGYPIYVSPLTTSYSDTNRQLTGIVGGPLSLQGLKNMAFKFWRRIGQRCREGCSSGGGGDEGPHPFGQEGVYATANINSHLSYGLNSLGSQSMDSSQMQFVSSHRGGSLGRSSLGGRGSIPSVGKPTSATLASLAGLLSSAEIPKGDSFLRERETSFTFVKERPNREEKEAGKRYDKDFRKGHPVGEPGDESRDNVVHQRVRIIHPNLVFDAINLGRRIDVLWPDEGMRLKGGRSHWKDWLPDAGMEGQVVHRWVPNHRDPARRSHVDKTILLVKVDDKYVPIAEAGVQDLGVEV